MTKKEAIRTARENELESVSWSPGYQAWYERRDILSRSELKDTRIITALTLLGMPYEEAEYRVYVEKEFEGVPFRTAIYRTKIGKENYEG